MKELFLSVLNMSLTASYVILFIIFIRLPLKKAPRAISYTLWSVAAFRLLCPFSFESVFSLLPPSAAQISQDITYRQSPQTNSGIVAQTYVSEALPSPSAAASADPTQTYTRIGMYIWFLGIAAMLIYSIVSVWILKERLKSARHIEQNIYEADNLKTPFVLGIFKPRIHIPTGLTAEEKSYIIRHEQTHIRRFDHIVKPFAFLVLSIHWFNPLVWAAFLLMSTDMELSCDERVIREMGGEIKKAYSSSLLSLAAGRRILNGSPLAFGEGNVKGRIKNVLNYRKPALWVITVALIAIIAAGIGLLSNPMQSVSLMDNRILPGEPQLDKVVSVTLRGPEGNQTASATITAKDGNFGWEQLVAFLESVMVNQKEINQNSAGSRDKTYQIIFNRQLGTDIYPVEINFNSDFHEVWINDTITEPGYSYRVINPSAVSDYLPVFFASLTAPTEQPLIFSSGETTDLLKLGTIAFDTYMALRMSEKTPINERIASYKLNDISVLAGDINEFCVSLNYDFTTDNENYVNPARGAKGKGTWPDNYLELRVQYAYEDVYAIKGIGTGGGGQGLTTYASQQTSLEPITPGWSPEQSIGADMAELDYASDDIVIFHCYFGLFVYDLDSLQIIRSLDLKPLKCTATQGDDYCDVTVSTDGNTVQLHRMSSKNMYVYTVSDNTLRETAYERMSNRFGSNFVPIEDVIDSKKLGNYSYNAVKFDTGEYGYLHTSDWTLGTLSYVRDDMMYRLFDIVDQAQAGQQHSIPVLSGKTYVDLIKDGNLEVSADDLSKYQLYTNSEKITVSMPKGDYEGTFILYDTENTADIQQFILNKDVSSKSFTNLTSARNYYIMASGLGDLTITVSD